MERIKLTHEDRERFNKKHGGGIANLTDEELKQEKQKLIESRRKNYAD